MHRKIDPEFKETCSRSQKRRKQRDESWARVCRIAYDRIPDAPVVPEHRSHSLLHPAEDRIVRNQFSKTVFLVPVEQQISRETNASTGNNSENYGDIP
jgi:hypothetical protein